MTKDGTVILYAAQRIKDLMAEVAQAQEENRIKGECLEIAMRALGWYAGCFENYGMAYGAVKKIKQRLAQLEPISKGITFVHLNKNHWKGPGRLCLNCGAFHSDEHKPEDWTCPTCQFQHQEPPP